MFCIFCPNLVVLACTGDEFWQWRWKNWGLTHRHIDTQTKGHTHGQTRATTLPECHKWSRVKKYLQYDTICSHYECLFIRGFIWKSIMFIFTFGAITLWRNAQKDKRIWRDRWDSKRKINCYESTRLLKGTIPRLHIRLGMINHITMWEMLSTQKPPDKMAFYFKTKIYSYTLSL